MRRWKVEAAAAVLGYLALCGALSAQPAPARPRRKSAASAPASKAPPAGSSQAAKAAEGGAFTKEQLEQLVAPIALYPDGLLTHVFMAATYPLQIVEARRFMEKNPGLEGDKLNEALKEHDWDSAVKSLCTFPDVLEKMNENLDWTQDLGDAMLGQQAELLDAVQRMRGKAYDSGNLKTTEQQTITVQQQPPPDPKIIVIESKDPEVIYVPTYSPTVVYGGWGYPYWYYPGMYPYYPYGYGFMSFTAGVIVGGAIWGSCGWGWGHSDVDIDIDNNFNFDRNTSRGDRVDHRGQGDRQVGQGDRQRGQGVGDRQAGQGGRQNWQHNPQNRKGVNYRDNATASKFGGTGASSRVSAAEARGRTGGTRQAGSTSGVRQAQTCLDRVDRGLLSGPRARERGTAPPARALGARDGAARSSAARSGSSRAGSGVGPVGRLQRLAQPGHRSLGQQPRVDESWRRRWVQPRGGGGRGGGGRRR